MKLPFMKFFPSDWLSDERLRMCSLAARGLWIECLCLMWKANRRGYLESSPGVPVSIDQLARVVGEPTGVLAPLIAELETAGVFSRDETTGVMFSRRVVKDVEFLAKCSEAGRKGRGNPTLRDTYKPPYKGSSKGASKGASEHLISEHLVSGSLISEAQDGGAPVTHKTIYAAYPKKAAPADAHRAIAKAIAGNPNGAAWLLERTKAYAAATAGWSDADRKFIPYPATWFNRASYDDDPATWQHNYSNQHQQKAPTPEDHLREGFE